MSERKPKRAVAHIAGATGETVHAEHANRLI